MLEPLRQTGFVTSTVLILSSLLALLAALLVQEALGQAPAVEQLPYHVATRNGSPQPGHWPDFGALLDARQTSSDPHPAVARIIVPEGPATAYGTGTLVDVREGFGLVITNWHVVRDASDVIDVEFPGGFRSQARAVKVDRDWDLAALVIWQPPLEPVQLADQAPQPGELLTIHGYGQGDYRIASGHCTKYYAPRADYPQQMVELDVEARQGDSGGPIFNDRGELAGVLFGAGQGTTIGSFGGRVETFLASLAPDIGRAKGEALAVASRRAAPHRDLVQSTPIRKPTASSNTMARQAEDEPAAAMVPSDDWPGSQWAPAEAVPSEENESPWSRAENPAGASSAANQEAAVAAEPSANSSNLLEQAKSILAIVGLVTICVQLARIVT